MRNLSVDFVWSLMPNGLSRARATATSHANKKTELSDDTNCFHFPSVKMTLHSARVALLRFKLCTRETQQLLARFADKFGFAHGGRRVGTQDVPRKHKRCQTS